MHNFANNYSNNTTNEYFINSYNKSLNHDSSTSTNLNLLTYLTNTIDNLCTKYQPFVDSYCTPDSVTHLWKKNIFELISKFQNDRDV